MPHEIVLYGPARAPYTEKCRRAMVLKGVDYELREPQGPEDFKRWSPETGLLPVMTVDGELISDSTDIVLRIDALYPDPPLLSADPKVAAQQRNLEDWADESFLWYFQQWLRISESNDGDATQSSNLPRFARRILAWLRAGGTWERPVIAILRGVDDRLNDLVNLLGARSFFYSESLSIADLAVYGMLFTLENDAIPGSKRLLSQRPALLSFMRRIEDHTGERSES